MKILTEQISARLEVLEAAGESGRPFRFRGTALVQGALSRNGRYYPPEVVARMVETAGEIPLTIYARHRDALEGTGLPVGRVDRLYLEGPALKYEATLAPTRLGRDLQRLIEGGFLVGASIRASPYVSRVVRLGDREVEWIDSLTLRGIDFTDDPGVPEAAGFEILEEARTDGAAARPPEEESMDLQSLDLETLRAQRPDLVSALQSEGAAVLEESRRQIGSLVDAAMAGDPSRQVVKERLLEECTTVAEAQERLEKERAYVVALRRAFLPSALFPEGTPAGKGLVENGESAGLDPERAHARRLAGVCG